MSGRGGRRRRVDVEKHAGAVVAAVRLLDLLREVAELTDGLGRPLPDDWDAAVWISAFNKQADVVLAFAAGLLPRE